MKPLLEAPLEFKEEPPILGQASDTHEGAEQFVSEDLSFGFLVAPDDLSFPRDRRKRWRNSSRVSAVRIPGTAWPSLTRNGIRSSYRWNETDWNRT